MSSVYDEGLYANWTAISFPAADVRAFVAASTQYPSVSFVPVDGDGNPTTDYDASKLRAIITGVDSGASVDLRNIPVGSGALFAQGTPTACQHTYPNGYHLPSGAAIAPGAEPVLGASINDGTVGNPGALVTGVGSTSYNGDAMAPACDLNFDPPAVPAFINGEYVTLASE